MPTDTFSFEEASGAGFPKLVPAKRTRTTELPLSMNLPSGSLLPDDQDIKGKIVSAADKFSVPRPILLALAQQESGFRPDAVGPQTKWGTAKGPFQYLDKTAQALGIDPFDVGQSANAAAMQLAEQIKKNGLEWAIAHHHAGPDPKQHGAKTAKYVQEVLAKASAIAKELGEDFELPSITKDEPETFSFEDAIPKKKGLLEQGNIDLTNRPIVKNKDGTVSTVRSISANFDGMEVLIPTVSDDGRLMSDEEAIKNYQRTGKHLGKFSDVNAANAYAEKLHEQQEKYAAENDEGFFGDIARAYKERFSGPALIGAGVRAIKKGWEGLQEVLNEDKVIVPWTEDELDKEMERLGVPRTAPEYSATREQIRRTPISAEAFGDEELSWKKRLQQDPSAAQFLPKRFAHLAPPKDLEGFIANLDNPAKLVLEDSLPSELVQYLAAAPEMTRKRFDEMRKVSMQENIVANPDKFPAVSVEAARKAIAERQAKQDPSLRTMWNDLKQAAKEDPGRFGAQLVNSLIADPEMLAAPVGIGAKPIQIGAAARGITVASRAARLADQIIDAGSTAAAMNVAAGATENLATTGKINTDEVKLNAALGYAIGGPMGAVFLRGARAHSANLEAAKASGAYEQILRDQAKADLALEEVILSPSQRRTAGIGTEGPSPVQSALEGLPEQFSVTSRESVDRILGITSKTDREKLVQQRRKEIKSSFTNESDYADYLKFLADERINRAQEVRQARYLSEQRTKAEAERASSEVIARRARMEREYDDAIAARNAAEVDDLHAQALTEDRVWETTRKLNNEEVLDAIFTKDDNTIKQAMQRANRRDAHLRRPKWQRGEVDPKLLARVGAVGLGAGVAFAVAPEEQKMSASILGGLAGLVIPGGGRVLSRMKQAGAISPEGDIVSLLVKKGKLANKLEAEEIMVRDNNLVDQVKSGNQSGMRQMYDAYYKPVTRYVDKFLREAGPKLGIDAEDVAQEAFFKAFQNIDSYSKEYPFEAWLKRIARNQALETIDRASTLKRDSLTRVSEEIPGAHDSYSGDTGTGSNVYERGAGSDTFDTPELNAVRQQSEQQLIKAFDKMPEDIQQAIVMSQLENYTDVQIAEMTNTPLGTIQRRIQRGKEMLTNSIKEELRGPRNQRGSVSPEDLKKILKAAGIGGVGAGIATYLSSDDIKEVLSGQAKTSTYFSIAASTVAALLLHGKVGRDLVKHADYAFGASSTRVMKHSAKLHRATLNLFRKNLEDVHKYFQQVDPFIGHLKQLPADVQNTTARAVMTGDGGVISKWLDYLGDPKLKEGYKNLRSVLDSLGDQLETLNRFKRGVKEYFPRIVTDKEGLFQAIDKQESTKIADILKQANVESMRKQGRPLNQVEESALINQVLFVDRKANQPGWAKTRAIEEITPELLKFYASPAESLHTYIRSAVEDINKAKFFGKYAKNMKKGNQEFLDVDRSINNMIAEEVKAGTLTDDGAREVADVLKSLFTGGEQAPAWILQEAKNLSNAGLLGNFWSAATQMGDVVMQTYLQGFRPALESVARQITGKKFVDMRDFGLMDSITAEFATQSKSARYVNKLFKYSLFSGIDRFGKNTALNAAIARAKLSMQSESGQLRFANKYSAAFGDDLAKLMSELKTGKFTDLTREWAFMELSRSQPVTKFEMSQWWLDSPNVGRSALTLKSFMLKQLDLVRRDGISKMTEGYNTGSKAKIAEGAMKLTQLGIIMGLAGTTSDLIKKFMTSGVSTLMGDEPEEINVSLSDIPLNALRTFGWSEYVKDRFFGVSTEEARQRRAEGEKSARARKAEPVKTTVEYFTPPFEMWTDLVTGDPNAYRYLIPLVGPAAARMAKKADEEEREAENEKQKSKKAKL